MLAARQTASVCMAGWSGHTCTDVGAHAAEACSQALQLVVKPPHSSAWQGSQPIAFCCWAGARQEKLATESGPRLQRWWLQDEAGGEVLAALGEERENRDGHYAYRAADTFAAARPLVAGNMASVHAWLEQACAPGPLTAPGLPPAAGTPLP